MEIIMKLRYQSVSLFYILTCVWAGGNNKCGDSQDFFDGCPTDCSEKVFRVAGEPTYWFNCSIGRKNDVDKFQRAFPDAFTEKSTSFDSPRLLKVNGFYQSYKGRELRSLSINFQLPKGIKTATGEFELPKAVLLQFRSIADSEFKDTFYHECERQRLFDFPNYSRPQYSTFDIEKPRNITYKCLVGLDNERMQNRQRRVYLISLTTAYGRTATYTVTTYAISEYFPDIWFPAIATHINTTNGTIYVVFEEAPQAKSVKYYLIELWLEGVDTVNESRQIRYPKPVFFYNLKKGNYSIKVTPEGDCYRADKCRAAQSYIIDGQEFPSPQDYPIQYLDDRPEIWIVVIVSIVVAVVFISVSIVFVMKGRKKSGPELGGERWGWIVHPYQPCCKKEMCVMKLGKYLEEACHCKFHPLTLPENIGTSVKQYCQGILKKSSFLLVVLDDGIGEMNPECTAECLYDYTISEALNIREKNLLHVYPITFPFSKHKGGIATKLSQLKPCSLLIEIDKLSSKICGMPPEMLAHDVKNGPSYVSLSNIVQDCSLNNYEVDESTSQCDPQDSDPLLEDNFKPRSPKTKKEADDIINMLNFSNEDISCIDTGARPKEIQKKSSSEDSCKDTHKPIVNQSGNVPSECDYVNNRQNHNRLSGHQHHHPLHTDNQQYNKLYDRQVSLPLDNRYPYYHQYAGRNDHDIKDYRDQGHHSSHKIQYEMNNAHWVHGNMVPHREVEGCYTYTSMPESHSCLTYPEFQCYSFEDQCHYSDSFATPMMHNQGARTHHHSGILRGNGNLQEHQRLDEYPETSIEKVNFDLNYSDSGSKNHFRYSGNDGIAYDDICETPVPNVNRNNHQESVHEKLLHFNGHSLGSVGSSSTGNLTNDVSMSNWDGDEHKSSFVPPDDVDENILSSQEQLAELESFNLKNC